MIEIQKPNIIKEDIELGIKSRYSIEPLERGFGITLGNSLRRILLGSMPGAAPVGIRINGVQHEFTAIPGIKEDVTDIILNIKGLAVKANTEDRNFKQLCTSIQQELSPPQIFRTATISKYSIPTLKFALSKRA